MSHLKHCAVIGLGSNEGDRLRELQRAVQGLSRRGDIIHYSSVWETKPWGKVDQQKFLNMVILMKTGDGCHQFFRRLQSLEHGLGRKKSEKWGPRTIDIDLIFFDDLQISTSALTLPHPRFRERAFVLAPLLEIAERSPVFFREDVQKCWEELPEADKSGVQVFLEKKSLFFTDFIREGEEMASDKGKINRTK